MPGSGLGLAIVRQVVERIGGTVTAAQSPQGGRLSRWPCPATRYRSDRPGGRPPVAGTNPKPDRARSTVRQLCDATPSNDQSPWQSSTGGGHDGDGGTTGQRPEYHRPPTSPFPAADEPTQSTAQPTTSPYPAAYGSVPTTPYGQSGAQYGQSGASYGQTGAGYGQTGTAYGQTDAAAAP